MTSTELLAKEMELGPICDACQTPLGVHGQAYSGQLCDFALTLKELMRAASTAFLGRDRYWEYKRRFEQLERETP